MDPLDRAQWVFTALGVLGLAIVAVSLTGEFLGWWNDWGEIGTVVGTLLAVVSLGAAFLLNSTKGQVTAVAVGITLANGKLDRANGKLDQANSKLDHIAGTLDTKLERQVELLADIRDRLR